MQKTLSHQMFSFAPEAEQGRLCLLVSLSHRYAEHEVGRSSAGQERAALGPVAQSLNPPVSGAASGKSLNTSEPHYLFCKKKKKYNLPGQITFFKNLRL